VHLFTVGFLAVAVGLSGCASKLVKTPEINAVKKVAIVSLFASNEVLFKHGTGKYDSWSWDTKERVAKMAHQAFEEEIKKLGWQMVPPSKVIASSVYQTEFGRTEARSGGNLLEKGLAVVQNVRNRRFFTIPKMTPIEWNKEDKNDRGVATLDLSNMSMNREKSLPERLEKLANDLGVDAVLLVEMDYCYGGGKSVAGNGEAYILGQATMYGVDKRGDNVITLPPIQNRCSRDRFAGKSARSTTMIGGSLTFGDQTTNQDKLVQMFYEATKSTARSVAKELHKAIREG
jgi:hypothetical protein